MAFKKADPQQARLKISIYGPPGSGKTFTTLLMAEGLARLREKRVAYIDTERGTDFYAKTVKARKVHPESFDFDAVYTRSLSMICQEVYAIDQSVHGVVVVDSISHVWDAAMEAYSGNKTKVDSIPMHAWSAIKKPYKDLINFLMGSQMDVFILGRQKNVFETDTETNEMKKSGVTMRAEGETAYEPHICIRMASETNPKDTTMSRVVAYVEKDRTGVLAGHSFTQPGFHTIEPILPLLGGLQAPTEDADERAMADAEVVASNEAAKALAKEGKSIQLFRTFVGQLQTVTSLPELNEVTKAMKKDKRYLVDDHQRSLREILDGVRAKLVEQATVAL